MDENILEDDFIEFMDHIDDDLFENRAHRPNENSPTNPFEVYDDNEFIDRFRFTKQVVRDKIIPLIYGNRQNATNRGLPISPEIKVTTALRFYDTGSYQTVCGDLVNISQPTVSRIVQEVSELLARNIPRLVHFPRNEAQKNLVKADFLGIAGFPNVLGCVDGTQIPIISPGGQNAEVYRNRKGFMSINVQLVAGPQLQIFDAVIRWPGSTHDSRIFSNSSLRWRFENLRGDLKNSFLLGDSGYAQTKYMYTPVLDPQTAAEQRYNRAQISTRNTVERTIGVLKRRFPCMLYELRNKLETTTRIIAACIVLHNIGRQWDPRDFGNEDVQLILNNWQNFVVDVEERVRDNERGRLIKELFIHRHFSNRRNEE